MRCRDRPSLASTDWERGRAVGVAARTQVAVATSAFTWVLTEKDGTPAREIYRKPRPEDDERRGGRFLLVGLIPIGRPDRKLLRLIWAHCSADVWWGAAAGQRVFFSQCALLLTPSLCAQSSFRLSELICVGCSVRSVQLFDTGAKRPAPCFPNAPSGIHPQLAVSMVL